MTINLDAIEAAAREATQGEWQVDPSEELRKRMVVVASALRIDRPFSGNVMSAAIAELDRLTAENERLREALAKIGTMTWGRPCDCERCDCRNVGDATSVAAWDAENAVRAEARAALETNNDAG